MQTVCSLDGEAKMLDGEGHTMLSKDSGIDGKRLASDTVTFPKVRSMLVFFEADTADLREDVLGGIMDQGAFQQTLCATCGRASNIYRL